MLKISELYNKSLTTESEDKDWNDEEVKDIKEDKGDFAGTTPAQWFAYIMRTEDIGIVNPTDSKKIIGALDIIVDAIGYAKSDKNSAIESFIGDNSEVYELIKKYIRKTLDGSSEKSADFGKALEQTIKNNYNIEDPYKPLFEETEGSVVTNEDELWEVIEDEFDKIKDMTKEEILAYITDDYPVSEPKIETINNVWNEYQIYKEKRIKNPKYREGIGSKEEEYFENIEEFNKKRNELETKVSNAENELYVAKQKEDKVLIKSARQKLNDAWKALNEFDENHFEADINAD